MTVERMEPKLPVGVVIFNKDRSRVLLVRHKPTEGSKAGLIGIPAGRPETGERTKSTGVREVREETGVTPMHLIDSGKVYKGVIVKEAKRKRYAIKVLAAQEYKGEDRGSNETTIVWAKVDTLPQRTNLMPSVVRIVSDALRVVNNNHNGHNDNGRR